MMNSHEKKREGAYLKMIQFAHFSIKSCEPGCEKTGLGVSDQVRHKPCCTTTEDS